MSTGPKAAPGWQFIQVPVSLPPILAYHDRGREAAHQVAGALAFWSSRIHRFNPANFPNSVLIAAYCADRIGGRQSQQRPTTDHIQGCILEVGDHLDPVSYQAISDLGVELRKMERSALMERKAAAPAGVLTIIDPRAPDASTPIRKAPMASADRGVESTPTQVTGGPSDFAALSDFGQIDGATAAMAGAASSLREAIRRRRDLAKQKSEHAAGASNLDTPVINGGARS